MGKIIGVIPARFASTRFPGKPLVQIRGKSMIRRVYERARKTSLSEVIVATDDDRIRDEVESFGGEVVMTSSDHQNGTERCAEVAASFECDYVINIQGDEPYIYPEQIENLLQILDGDTQVGTLIKKINDDSLLFNPTVMKVLVDHSERAIYFSRQCIPYLRNFESSEWIKHHTFWKHVGIYAYRSDILQKIVKLPVSNLERAESLEQLRWIENGYPIKIAKTEKESISIDTPADLERLNQLLQDGEIS